MKINPYRSPNLSKVSPAYVERISHQALVWREGTYEYRFRMPNRPHIINDLQSFYESQRADMTDCADHQICFYRKGSLFRRLWIARETDYNQQINVTLVEQNSLTSIHCHYTIFILLERFSGFDYLHEEVEHLAETLGAYSLASEGQNAG